MNAIVSKRSYAGTVPFMNALKDAFNYVRPRTAELQPNRDGSAVVFVQGWNDWHASAVYSLVCSGIPLRLFDERTVNAKANELFKSGQPVSGEYLGKVIMSDKGAIAPTTPEEFGGPQEAKTEEAPIEEIKSVGRIDPHALPETASTGKNDPPPEDEEIALGESQRIYGPHTGLTPPPGIPGAADATVTKTERGFEIRIPIDPETISSGEQNLLLQSESMEVGIRISGPTWRFLKMLSVAHNMHPSDFIHKIISEGLEPYRDPHRMALLFGAIDN